MSQETSPTMKNNEEKELYKEETTEVSEEIKTPTKEIQSVGETEKSFVENSPKPVEKRVPPPKPVKESKETEITEEETEIQEGFSFSLEKQKPLNECSFEDVIYWRNVYLSLFLFIAGHALYALLTKYDYSVTTLIGRIMMAQIIIFILLMNGYKYYKGKEAYDETSHQFKSNFKLTEEYVIPMVKNFIQKFNNTTKSYTNLLLLVDLPRTLRFLALLQLICFFGNRVSGITLVYVVFLYLFIIPKVYQMKKKEIDELFEKVLIKGKEQLSLLVDKLPPSLKVYVEKLKFKNE
jgi:membrane protein YdbS with pleckstrin-like domain